MTLNTDNSKHQLLVLSPSTPISSCTQEVSQLHLTRFFLCYLSVCLAVWPKTEHESVMTVRIILLMTQSRSTISSTRHWSRQAKGASLLISADNGGDTPLCTSLNVAMRGLSWCLRSIQATFLQHTRPGDCDHHSRYDRPQTHTPGPGAWKQIGWNFQIIFTFLAVGPLLPHTLHGSSLLHTREQHANSSKTSPHTTSIREGVNMLPTTTNFST